MNFLVNSRLFSPPLPLCSSLLMKDKYMLFLTVSILLSSCSKETDVCILAICLWNNCVHWSRICLHNVALWRKTIRLCFTCTSCILLLCVTASVYFTLQSLRMFWVAQLLTCISIHTHLHCQIYSHWWQHCLRGNDSLCICRVLL